VFQEKWLPAIAFEVACRVEYCSLIRSPTMSSQAVKEKQVGAMTAFVMRYSSLYVQQSVHGGVIYFIVALFLPSICQQQAGTSPSCDDHEQAIVASLFG
jgi:hypothetical protein